MTFLEWYGIGVATIVLTFLIEGYRNSYRDMRIRRAFNEVYEILVTKADMASTIVLGLVALLGPVLPFAFAYFIVRNWYDALAVDDDGNKDYPWTKD